MIIAVTVIVPQTAAVKLIVGAVKVLSAIIKNHTKKQIDKKDAITKT